MTQKYSSLTKLIIPSFSIWLIALVISFFFYSPEGELSINFWLFKIIMFIVSFTASFLVLSRHYKKHNYSWLSSSIAIIIYNIILDLVVLVALLGTSIGEYFLTIATVYVVFIPLSNYLALRNSKKIKTTK